MRRTTGTIITFDIGGTHTRIALSNDGATLSKPEVFETPANFNDGLEVISAKIKEITDGNIPEKIIGGIAGVLHNGKILHSPNLPGWNDNDLGSALSNEFPESTVVIENDADLSTLGEAIHGSGKGVDRVAFYTVSTGIGGGFTVNGKIQHGIYGFEPGYQIIDQEKDKTLESVASGTAIMKKYGKVLPEVDDPEALNRIADALAIGINNSIVHWSPNIFVLGGSVIFNTNELIGLIEKKLKDISKIYPTLPQIKIAELGDESTLFGALALANSSDD